MTMFYGVVLYDPNDRDVAIVYLYPDEPEAWQMYGQLAVEYLRKCEREQDAWKLAEAIWECESREEVRSVVHAMLGEEEIGLSVMPVEGGPIPKLFGNAMFDMEDR